MDLGLVLALAALPALGNFAGGALAELVQVSPRTLSLALHVALGILLAVVGIELVPEALAEEPRWVPVLALVAGGASFFLIDRVAHLAQARLGGSGDASAWAVFFAVAIDLFSDGLLIGTGAAVASGLAVLIALAQVTADFPEGFATIAGFKRQGVPRRRRLLIAAAFAVPVLLGALVSFLALRTAPALVQVSALAFTAGLLLAVAVEEIGPEAHEAEDVRFAPLALVGGFGLFTLVAAYTET